MAPDMAEARGRVMIRPWRVGLLLDTTSAEQVREAIANLSSVWGGYFMPMFDINAEPDELERLGRRYDVDSLYADVTGGPLGELLRKPGWSWSGRGPWGPFGEEDGFRKGLLPTCAFVDQTTDLLQPTWDDDDALDLVYAATWGLEERLGVQLRSTIDSEGPRSAHLTLVTAQTEWDRRPLGTLVVSRRHVTANPRAYLDDLTGVYVIRADHPEDVVEFWNMRIYGTAITGVPVEGDEGLLRYLLAKDFAGTEIRSGGSEGSVERVLRVWGLDDASGKTAQAIESAALRGGLTVWSEPRGSWPNYVFQGVRTPFSRSVRVDFRPEAHWIDVPSPVLPIGDEPDAYARGVVAAEVELHNVWGQDPRSTASLPPFRRHSSLVRSLVVADGIDHARVTHDGLALGIDADRDHVRVPFAYNLDVMRLLFNNEAVKVAQSDVGKFQSRAAEKFGGLFSGVLNQPGVRAAIALAAGKDSGVTLPHLRQVVQRDQGSWPDPLFEPKMDPNEYATRQVNYLLHSGLFIPMLKVHCSHCRVERQVSADDLAAAMSCEFCGQSFNLALSLSLSPSEWRYRLAAHLRPGQVQALMPALAVAGLLKQFRHIEEPPLPHVLGLETMLDGKTVEVDVAAYLPDNDWTAVLGEVKTRNRIDINDIENLEFLQRKLHDQKVRCLLLFGTLKEELSPDEVTHLRSHVERSAPLLHPNGQLSPHMPLVLTQANLSQPPGSKEHPWRWDRAGVPGIFGTAIVSCQRNLGLQHFEITNGEDGLGVRCEWAD